MNYFNPSSKQNYFQNQQPMFATNYYVTSSNASNLGAMQYGAKTSKYLGVNRIMNKEAYVANVYDCGFISRQPRTLYLGTFDKEEDAARAHDLVSLKLWGPSAYLNFPANDYAKAMERMAKMTEQEVIASIRRTSSNFVRRKSRFLGVERHRETGKWQVRVGANKDLILGIFETEEEAAVAFDMACIRQKGYQAITNYDLRCYDIEGILNASKIQQQQPEADPLSLNIGIGCANPNKPTPCRISLPYQNQETQELRDFFVVWALQTARKELANASNNNFNHGDFSPFCSYKQMKHNYGAQHQIKSATEKWLRAEELGFNHANSSGFKPFKNDKGKAKLINDV